MALNTDAAPSPSSTKPTANSDSGQKEIATVDPFANGLVLLYEKSGPHPEYCALRDSTIEQTARNAFDFIRDAVEGTGGFQDGTYIDQHYRELERPDPQTGGSTSQPSGASPPLSNTSDVTRKLVMRRKLADYDNYARVICDTYWGYIIQTKDEIKRATTFEPLEDFWENVDLNRTEITDFIATGFRQARMYGTGFICVDRPDVAMESEAENMAEENRPYAYNIPSRNVLHWMLDDDGRIEAILWAEPYGNIEFQVNSGSGGEDVALRCWTKETWSYWIPVAKVDKKADTVWELKKSGPNELGEVPIVLIYNEAPMPDRFLGRTEMKNISMIAKTTFNLDSEMREIERNCAFPILTAPMRDQKNQAKYVISTEAILGYDSSGPPPEWLEPNLDSLAKLQTRREKKVEQAYAMAHLAAITGVIQTQSGFHVQAEFDKSNRRIGLAAATCEAAEMNIARLVCLWYGKTDEQIETEGPEGDSLYSIVYPRNFGLRDQEAVILRTATLIGMQLGHDANVIFLRDMYDVLYPRKKPEELQALAEASANELEKIAIAEKQQADQRNQDAVTSRVRSTLSKAGINIATGFGEAGMR